MFLKFFSYSSFHESKKNKRKADMTIRKILCTCLLALTVLCGWAQQPSSVDMKWWRESRFGMFIHWGLYSVAVGEWNGKPVDGIGEWIQNFAKIPNSEYEKLADRFTMARYNPDAWATMAREAGARYVVFTTKHHEGFCLYPSDVSDFDVRRTPYHGDPLKELVDACRRQGLKVGFYYSHRQDWREEDAAVMKNEYDGHYGKLKSEIKPNLNCYIQQKALPQMRELLTRYGKIDVLWYDTPFDLTREQSQQFVDVVRKLQPSCIVNGRVGYDLGDYGALGDNEMPCMRADSDLEMVATMNHTWGYKKNDNHWKSPKDILCSLLECASRGVNYMVNIGPMADGTVPQPSIDILGFVGRWMAKNAEAVQGTQGNPFNDNFPWGYATRRNNILYLHLLREPQGRTIELKGVLSPITSAQVLSSGQSVSVANGTRPVITVPSGLNYDEVPVLKITCQTPARFSEVNYMNENVISIPVAQGHIMPGDQGKLHFSAGGITENFHSGTGKVKLSCLIDEPGVYKVRVFTSRHWRKSFAQGARITLKVDENVPFESVVMKQDGELDNVRRNSYPESWSDIGTVAFEQKGEKHMELSVNDTGRFSRLGFFGEDIQNESEQNIRFMRIELIKQ